MVVDESMLMRVPFCPGQKTGAGSGWLVCVTNRECFWYLGSITTSRHSYRAHCRYGQHFMLGQGLQFS